MPSSYFTFLNFDKILESIFYICACTFAILILCVDYRPSSIALSQAAQDGVKVLGGQVVDYGMYCLLQERSLIMLCVRQV